MSTSDSWPKLEADFMELSTSAGDLRAHAGPPAWELTGGPSDDRVRKQLHDRFDSLARLAGVKAGVPNRANARDGWLNLVREESPHFTMYKGGMIASVCLASAETCRKLEHREIELEKIAASGGPYCLRRDMYKPPGSLYDHDHEEPGDANAELEYWRRHCWDAFRGRVENIASVSKNRELRGDSPLTDRVELVDQAMIALCYDLAVAQANYILDVGLRGDDALQAFRQDKALLVEIESVAQQAFEPSRVEGAGLALAVPFRRVREHLRALLSRMPPEPTDSRKENPARAISEDPIHKARRARPQIKQFADDAFSVARDRILTDYAQELNRLPDQVRRTGNSGAYLPARIKLEKERLRNLIHARAGAWLEAFDLHGVPSDTEAEKDLQTCARQMTAGSISAIRGELRLRSVRLRIAEEGHGVPWHLEIEKLMNSVLKENVLRLKRQQIKSKHPEGQSRSGLTAEGPAEVSPPPSRTAATSRNKARLKPQFPNRASWLKDRLRERSWNKNDLARQRGPDRKTTQKVLDGLSVREDVLEKLAIALSNKGAKVTVLNIPPD